MNQTTSTTLEKSQIDLIKSILFDLFIAEYDTLYKTIDQKMIETNYNLIQQLHDVYDNLSKISIGFLLHILMETNSYSHKEIVNIIHMISNLLYHHRYYQRVRHRVYVNDYWDNYIIKKKKHLYYFIDYRITSDMNNFQYDEQTRRPLCLDNNSKFD